jgi:hypothetical protein
MGRRLFEKADDVSDRVRYPLALYGGGTIGPQQTATITLGGGLPDEVWFDRRLRSMIEDQIVDMALDVPGMVLRIAEELEMRMPVWCLIRTLRRSLFPSTPEGQPGDFDVIIGEAKGRLISLERLALVECKLGKVRSTDAAPKYASGRGTNQVANAVTLGFDQVLLLHFLVRDPVERSLNQAAWADAADNAKFTRQMERVDGALAADDDDPPYGAMIIGWGHINGVNPALAGAFSPVPLRKAPMLSRDRARERRAELKQNLRRLLPESRPVHPFFRFCQKCDTEDLFGCDRASRLLCDSHR